MSKFLNENINKKVLILCNDGKVVIGMLRGVDDAINVIVEDAVERVYSMDKDVEEINSGIMIIRGDDIAVIGEYSQELDESLDVLHQRANHLKPIVH